MNRRKRMGRLRRMHHADRVAHRARKRTENQYVYGRPVPATEAAAALKLPRAWLDGVFGVGAR